MTASQLRAQARKKLTGKWGKAALLFLVFLVITYIISFVLNLVPMLGAIISMVISVPLSYGFVVSMFKINDGEEVSYLDFLNNGFSNFGKVWSITLNTALKLILPIIFVIVCAVIFTYATVSGNSILAALGFILYFVAIIYCVIKQFSYKLSLYVY